MSSQQLDEEAIFHVARDIHVAGTREKYLDQICGGDQALRDRVEALLEVHENEQAFLKSDPDAAATVDHTPLTEHPGSTIGRYKLMEQIGEGGMGTVFVAEQERPIRRKAALKVIKPGMDSKAVVARFEAERQALALMDHPNIAKVLDAGTTDTGRPYFVMELVRGIPITEYCDQHKLTIRERLSLFTQVCQAIQHAHQKAIIHRDIKPTNVLVTEQDGKPVPKVIDFGVAKALNQRLTDRTIYTSFAQVVGTPLYMSPEQAALSAVDVDTRSDVYSLGVLLYELLTGTTPFDRERFERAAYDEVRRIVREEEPPKPSTKISTLGDERNTVAQNRRIDSDKLGRSVRGDLDWIVMKALDKDRTRRYESASAFEADISAFLGDDPIGARPPTLRYRTAKYLRRNRIPLAVTCLLIVSLTVGLIGTLSQAQRAQERENDARVQAETAYRLLGELKDELKNKAITAGFSGDRQLAESAIERAIGEGIQPEWNPIVLAILEHWEGNTAVALSHARAAVAKNEKSIPALGLLAITQLYTGDAEEFLQTVLRIEKLEPAAAEDFLFKGYVWIYIDSQEAVDLIGRAVRERRAWAIARAIYAEALAQKCLDFDELDDAIEAIRQTEIARELQPANVYVLAMSVHANHVALRRSKQLGLTPNENWEKNARATSEVLKNHDSFVFGTYIRAELLAHLGEHDEAEATMLDYLKSEGGGGVYKVYLAGHLYARGDSARAAHVLYPPLSPLVFGDMPDGAERARAAYKEQAAYVDQSLQLAIWRPLYPAFWGEEEAAQVSWKNLYSQSNARTGFWLLDHPLSIWSGHGDPEVMLQRPNMTNKEKSGICFFAGVSCLIHDDRKKAEQYFQQAVDLDVFTDPLLYWAQGHLTRLRADPKWPALRYLDQ